MKCPNCGHQEDRVVDSRLTPDGSTVRRRRECSDCGHRFTTLEEIVRAEIFVTKQDRSREEYNPAKLRQGIERALWKRPVTAGEIEELIGRINQRVEALGEREVPSKTIGELVMAELQDFDQVAYVRFASVYRQFKDIEQFVNEIGSMTREKD